MSDLIEAAIYDEMEDKMVIKTTYDNSGVIDENQKIKQETNHKAIQRYKGDMVHACRLHEGDVVRLKNMGYNILSPDKEEVRRALVYIQNNEPHLMLVNGKPFAKQRVKWA